MWLFSSIFSRSLREMGISLCVYICQSFVCYDDVDDFIRRNKRKKWKKGANEKPHIGQRARVKKKKDHPNQLTVYRRMRKRDNHYTTTHSSKQMSTQYTFDRSVVGVVP